MMNRADAQLRLLRRSEMRREIGLDDSELRRTAPEGKSQEDNPSICCPKCPQRYRRTLREASRRTGE